MTRNRGHHFEQQACIDEFIGKLLEGRTLVDTSAGSYHFRTIFAKHTIRLGRALRRRNTLLECDMDETISTLDTITLRTRLDIWALAPMSQAVPRAHVESLYVRVTTSGGVVGWGESFGTAHPMVAIRG